MISDQQFTRRLWQTVFTTAGAGILLAALWAAREALLLIYISALFAMGFAPLVRAMERTDRRAGLPRWLAILIIYLLFVTVLALVGLMVIPPLIAQATTLWSKIPTELDRVQTFLIHYKLLDRRFTLAEAVQSAPPGANAVSTAVGTLLGAISTFAGGLFGIVTILILSFYLLLEVDAMFAYMIRFVPEERRESVAVAAQDAAGKVSAWLQAQMTLAGVMGTVAAIALGLMSVPYFYVVAVVAAVGETIPIVGPVIGGVAAVAVALTASPKLALMVGVFYLVLHQLESNILVPKIMERRVGVSPVVVMVALLIGGSIWGVIGAILAIPTAGIISVIIESGRNHQLPIAD